jgi:hypothetical protein
MRVRNRDYPFIELGMVIKIDGILKVHMHEIFKVCFKPFICIFQALIDTKHSTANIFKNLFQIRPDIQIFNHSPFPSKRVA